MEKEEEDEKEEEEEAKQPARFSPQKKESPSSPILRWEKGALLKVPCGCVCVCMCSSEREIWPDKTKLFFWRKSLKKYILEKEGASYEDNC